MYGDKNMTFSEAYKKVDKMYFEWGMKGVALVGETENAWIFKSHVINGNDLSGGSVIVEKTTGEMRLFNIGYLEDRKVGYNAKIIDNKTLTELLTRRE